MRLCPTSDWHGQLPPIPPCDLLVLAGDYEPTSHPLVALASYRLLGAHLRASRAEHIVMIAGNHDWRLYQDRDLVLRVLGLGSRLHYLQDDGCTIGRWRIWGSPWTPPFFNWAFMKDESALAEVYARIPADVDILVTHGPPRGVLDGAAIRAGSAALLAALARIKPQIHVFGHIHEHGGETHQLDVDDFGACISCYNVSHVDAGYRPAHNPRLIEVTHAEGNGAARERPVHHHPGDQ